MPVKKNEYYAYPVKGKLRNSAFADFSPYANNGSLSVETVTGQYNGHFPNGGWTGGGSFLMNRDIETFSPIPFQIDRYSGSGNTLLTSGTARIENPTTSVGSLEGFNPMSTPQLVAMGATAISRIEPTNPAFDFSTFLGEITAEGLPSLPTLTVRDQVLTAKAAGKNYLSAEFGWLPLVRGIRDFSKAVDNADRITRQYQEGANKRIKRRYDFPSQSASRAEPCSFSMQPAVAFFTGGGMHQQASQDVWVEASFRYYLPTGGSTNDKFRRYGSYARKILGIDLTPEVLWNLAPWSWAADWVANTGDVLHNISAIGTDSLVIEYAYIMCHTRYTTTYSGSYQGRQQVRVRLQETKQRLGATPYGFGLAYSDFTPKQLAIIAALGLSRS